MSERVKESAGAGRERVRSRLTLYGRKTVLEALEREELRPQRLFISRQSRGEIVERILERARARSVPIKRLTSIALSRISKNKKQDQGVALDLHAPQSTELEEVLKVHTRWERPIFLLDGLTTPANIGMLLRSLVAAEVEGIVWPRVGSPGLCPLVYKASAGLALQAPIWWCNRAEDAARALRERGLPLFGLRSWAAPSLYKEKDPSCAVWVIGNESEGISVPVSTQLTGWRALPMGGGVESLNAATAGAIVAFELARRRRARSAKT